MSRSNRKKRHTSKRKSVRKSKRRLRLARSRRRSKAARRKPRLKRSAKRRRLSFKAGRKRRRHHRKPKKRRKLRRKLPNKPPLLRGVNLIGLARTEIGIGESCRLAARALQTTDIPFGILNLPGVSSAREMDMTWAHKEMNAAVYHVNIVHMNPDTLKYAYKYFGRSTFHGRYNIGYWHWELPDFPDEFRSGFDLVQEVWAPSTFVRDSIARKSPVPVIKIPHGIEVHVSPDLQRDAFGLPHNRFLFLTMYDTHSYQHRKNPQAVIAAFQAAFGKDRPDVGLVLKLNNAKSNPSDLAVLKRLVSGQNNIYIIDRTLARHEVNRLMNCTDCFVSLHRSEGFGLGLAEAMYLGKPVIGTNWSGNTDFMNSANSCPVNCRIVRVGQDHGPYKAHQYWAEPDIRHAADYMWRLVHDPEWRHSIATNGQNTIRSQFSPQAVGALIKQRLTALGLL